VDAICSEYISLVAQRASEANIEMREVDRNRRYGSYEAEIESVEMLDADGRPVRAVRCGDRVRFEVSIKLRKELEDPSVGILIRDRLGNDIFGTNTCLAQVPIPMDVTRSTVVFELDLDVGPRHYYLATAVHSGTDHLGVCYDWIDNAVAFEVLPGEEQFSGYARLKPRITVRNRN
ncbi:MAG: Wzt carbohydrate-binding domain-containing protein, partial [Acidobacteriota bacterium]